MLKSQELDQLKTGMILAFGEQMLHSLVIIPSLDRSSSLSKDSGTQLEKDRLPKAQQYQD